MSNLRPKDITTTTIVSPNCWARLMYYLYSVNCCLRNDGDDPIPVKLRYYQNYPALTMSDKLAILNFVAAPYHLTKLSNRIFFPVDELQDGSSNEFFKTRETTELLALGIQPDRFVHIEGTIREITTIMAMTQEWAERFFITAAIEAFDDANNNDSYQSPSPYPPRPHTSSGSSGGSDCLTSLCGLTVLLVAGLVYVAINLKRFVLLLIGLLIIGYVSYEIASVYSYQQYALDASSYSSWPNGNHTATIIGRSGEDWTYLKVYFDSSGEGQTANALMATTAYPSFYIITYARGRYSWWDRKFIEQPYSGATDLLSKDSFVYFRFDTSGWVEGDSFNVTLTGVHSTFGSTDWTTIQWVQQLWFYGLFSLGALLVVVSVGTIIFFCFKRREND